VRTLALGGGKLTFDVRGEGPALLFLHAFPLSLAMWDAQAEALAGSHSVVRFDCRGFGGSSPGEGLLSMERIAEDAVAVLDHAGFSKAVVCGCSMGGYAAFALWRRHPQRVRGLVLMDTRAEPDSEEARRNRALLAEKVRREGAAAAVEAFLPKLLGVTTQRERPEIVERVRATILGTSPQGIADALAGLAARADSRPTLRQIRVPTLVVCGEEDVLTPPADAEALRAGIAGARLALVPKAGHLPGLENPGALLPLLEGFLAEC
jgi:pimeloyl-ACP methyl ester carboxylesterase